MNKVFASSALAIAASVSVNAFAQGNEVIVFDPILVTPNRVPLKAGNTLASTSIITREDIERENPQDTLQLLSTLPSVQVVRNGATGQTANLYLRGTEADHTLVLIDGLRASAATNGATALQHLPVDQIERIEIVRGPRASLYGADTIGGVINIFTREAGPFALLEGGSHRSHKAAVGFGNDYGSWSLSGSATSFGTDGYDTSTLGQPDKDGYQEDSVAIQTAWKAREEDIVELSFFRSQGDVEFDDGTTEFINQSFVSSAQFDIGVRSRLSFTLGQTIDERDTSGSNPAFDKTTRDHVSTKLSLTRSNSISAIGFDYYNDKVDVEEAIAETQRSNLGVFGQHQILAGEWDAQLSARYDDNEAYGSEITGNVAVGRSIGQSSQLFLSYGTAFKAPTFNDLYNPDVAFSGITYSSNPELDSETSQSAEAGFRWQGEGKAASISAFHTDIDNLIVNQTADGISRPENVSKARIRGIEVSGSINLAGFSISGTGTLQDPEDQADGSLLPKRAKRSVAFSAATRLSRWNMLADLRYVGETGGGAFSAVPGYTVVGFSAERSLATDWSVRLDIENLFDHKYETTPNYPAPGRTVFLTIEWRPGS